MVCRGSHYLQFVEASSSPLSSLVVFRSSLVQLLLAYVTMSLESPNVCCILWMVVG